MVLAFVAARIIPSIIHPHPPAPTKKAWVLVAEFDGPPDDPGLAAAAHDLVAAALDQSTSLSTVSREQIRTALVLADRPPDARVDAALARELAYRNGIPTVVEGRISRLGAGSAVVVRVVDAERDSLVLSVSDVARDDKALIPTIARVTRRVREGLGERRDAIQDSRDLPQVRTGSLEAFKIFQRAGTFLVTGDSDGAIAQCRAALALDPDFASAYVTMGYAFINMGRTDSAATAWRRALSRPERLSDRLKLATEAALADLNGDYPRALAIMDRIVQLDPSSPGTLTNKGYLLYRTGEFEAALSSLAQAEKAGPLGRMQMSVLNRFNALLALGRLDEAQSSARELRGTFGQTAMVWLAAAEGDWARVDSLGTALEAPTASREMRRLGALAAASAAAARGEVLLADQALRRAEGCEGATPIPAARVSDQAAHRARLLLALVTGRRAGEPEGGWPRDSTVAALVTRGLWAAAGGDLPRTRRLLYEVRSRPADERRRAGADPTLLEGWLAMQSGRWDEAVRVLGPAARQGSEIGFPEDRAGRVTLRWLMARAYEQLGRPDSAAVYLEMMLSPLGRVDQEHFARGIGFSFAHRELVLLYARMGRLEDARRHWEIFSATFTRPDPEMAPRVEEARAALASAEAMARSVRR